MAGEKVLIIDDDPAIRRLLEKVMASNQLETRTAASAEEALEAVRRESYSLLLLDVMMGDMDGFEFLKRIRRQNIATPVIIVSGKNEDYDTLYGLELGADDYITKPFNPVVLGAKVKAMIRRNNLLMSQSSSLLQAGPFIFDRSTMKLTREGEEIFLSSKETMLMLLFMEHVGQVFSREQIYQQVWGDWGVDENTVMVHISHLRNKIEKAPGSPRHIVTIRGLGYKFVV